MSPPTISNSQDYYNSISKIGGGSGSKVGDKTIPDGMQIILPTNSAFTAQGPTITLDDLVDMIKGASQDEMTNKIIPMAGIRKKAVL
ncbi:MAG: hypothetical protein AABZ14_08405, partial [Candidatus Margulisiibacteriota bacterium]